MIAGPGSVYLNQSGRIAKVSGTIELPLPKDR
jgi:hypothetical protein